VTDVAEGLGVTDVAGLVLGVTLVLGLAPDAEGLALGVDAASTSTTKTNSSFGLIEPDPVVPYPSAGVTMISRRPPTFIGAIPLAESPPMPLEKPGTTPVSENVAGESLDHDESNSEQST